MTETTPNNPLIIPLINIAHYQDMLPAASTLIENNALALGLSKDDAKLAKQQIMLELALKTALVKPAGSLMKMRDGHLLTALESLEEAQQQIAAQSSNKQTFEDLITSSLHPVKTIYHQNKGTQASPDPRPSKGGKVTPGDRKLTDQRRGTAGLRNATTPYSDDARDGYSADDHDHRPIYIIDQ